MTYDHQAVAGGREVDPELARMHRLLDEEILPRLERPGRFIEPLRARGIELGSAVAHRPLLLWPSAPEGAGPAAQVLRLRDALERASGVALDYACATPADLRAQLGLYGLPPFSLPDWIPLAHYPVWLAWLDQPSQVAGLVAVLLEAGLPVASSERGQAAPLLIAAGPGAAVAPELAAAFADAVLNLSTPESVGPALGELVTRGRSGAGRRSLQEWTGTGRAYGAAVPAVDDAQGLCALRSATAAAGAPEPPPALAQGGAAPDSLGRRLVDESIQACLPGHLHGAWFERRDPHSGWLRLGAASASLRAQCGLTPDAALIEAAQQALASTSGRLVVQVAVGLPGETPADGAALLLLAEQLAELVTDAERRVTLRIAPFVDAMHLHPSATWSAHERARAAWGAAAAALVSRDPVDHAGAWLEGRLAAHPHLAARVLLLLATGRDGAEGSGARAVPDAPSWRRTLAQVLASVAAPACPATASGAAVHTPVATAAEAAPTGLEPVCDRERAARRARAGARAAAPAAQPEPEPWRRWHSLVPRHFDYRLEYEKRGRLRHLGHRELAEAFLRACQKAHLPVATTGSARPRPRLTFGPPLPVGIEGLQEFVDLGLAHKVPHLRPTLNEWLPDGLLVDRASFIPPGAIRNALCPPAAACYEAVLPVGCWRAGAQGPQQLGRRVEALRAAERWPVPGREGLDAKVQVTDLMVHQGEAGVAMLAFTLDVAAPTAKVGPGELLDMLLADLVHEVRLLRVRRTRLLVARPGDAGAWITPSEQVLLAHRRLREKVKHCA